MNRCPYSLLLLRSRSLCSHDVDEGYDAANVRDQWHDWHGSVRGASYHRQYRIGNYFCSIKILGRTGNHTKEIFVVVKNIKYNACFCKVSKLLPCETDLHFACEVQAQIRQLSVGYNVPYSFSWELPIQRAIENNYLNKRNDILLKSLWIIAALNFTFIYYLETLIYYKFQSSRNKFGARGHKTR